MELDELVLAAKKGDERAWNRLVAWVEPRLRAFLKRRCGSAVIDDLVQEALAIAYEKRGTLRANSSAQFKSWVFSIAFCNAKKTSDRNNREGHNKERLAKVERAPSTSVASRLDRHRQLARIRSRLEELPPAQQRAIRGMLDGKDACDVAEEAGISVESARSTELKALRRLSKVLGSKKTPAL